MNGVTREADGERITEGWAAEEAEVAVEVPVMQEEVVPGEVTSIAQIPSTSVPIMASGVGGTPITITLKDAEISIGKIIVKRKEKKK